MVRQTAVERGLRCPMKVEKRCSNCDPGSAHAEPRDFADAEPQSIESAKIVL
jgi:hypothetical protein